MTISTAISAVPYAILSHMCNEEWNNNYITGVSLFSLCSTVSVGRLARKVCSEASGSLIFFFPFQDHYSQHLGLAVKALPIFLFFLINEMYYHIIVCKIRGYTT